MAVIGLPLINGIEYTHADIVINILGTPVIGVTAIDYSDPQDMTGNHGTGANYVSLGIGPINPQGSITLTMKEIQRLSNIAPLGQIQNIPLFPITVIFTTEAGDFTRHRLINCKMKGRNPNSTVGNSQIEEKIELFIGAISYKPN
jgi:hypothetical protein